VTGPPGAGKSTLVDRMTRELRAAGRRVGVIAVDPSSPFTGGAVLGDRVRMQAHASDDGVFIRSMATRGQLGGLARATGDVALVLDAAGKSLVVIETVGVGQDEVEVARAAHTTVVVSAPGLGDDIQAIKAGILEIADIHAVSKCDRPDANKTIADLKNMLALGLTKLDTAHFAAEVTSASPAWRPPVIATSSIRDEGVAALLAAIDEHRAALERTGDIERRRAAIAERRLLASGEAILREQFVRHRDGKLAGLLEQLRARSTSPNAAARALLRQLNIGGET